MSDPERTPGAAPRAGRPSAFRSWGGWLLFLAVSVGVAGTFVVIERRQVEELKTLAVETFTLEGIDRGYLRFLVEEFHEECVKKSLVPTKKQDQAPRSRIEYLRAMKTKLYYALLPGESAERWQRFRTSAPDARFDLAGDQLPARLADLDHCFERAAVILNRS